MYNIQKVNVCSIVMVLLATVLLGLFLGIQRASAALGPGSDYDPVIHPSDFSTTIDNKYFSLPIGAKFKSRGETDEGTETIEITISGETKMIMGVQTLVYRDKVWLDGELIEDTKDYLAQDEEGNVWYFGENVNNYAKGKLKDHEGSWIAGVDGALPGIWMKAKPVVGETYRQEYYKGEAEDTAKVLSLTETVTVPYGTFTNCLKTLDVNPLEVGTEEYKYYCTQVQGFVLEVGVKEGERIELIDVVYGNNDADEDAQMVKLQTLITLLNQLIELLIQQRGA